MEKLTSCRFEPLAEISAPSNALLWTTQEYYDGSGWVSLPDKDKLALKPTRFADHKLLFLEPVEGVLPEFKATQSGKYDVKCWKKFECCLGIEGDKTVFIKIPSLANVAVYEHHNRLPTFPKAWKPLIFMLNDSVCSVRLTENFCLMVMVDASKSIQTLCVDYNGGFLCTHPMTNLALAYGSYAVKGFENLPNCDVIPKILNTSGEWGFFVHFFPWGCLIIPKTMDLSRPQTVLGAVGLGHKKDIIGVVLHFPKMVLNVRLEAPAKVNRSLKYGVDYLLTACKSSETDIDISLIMDGQLVKYNHSFDIRINKPDKPKHTDNIPFKCTCDAEEKKKPNPKFTFLDQKHQNVLVKQGCPLENNSHIVNSETLAVFDAEICLHYTHPPALKHTKAFQSVALPAED